MTEPLSYMQNLACVAYCISKTFRLSYFCYVLYFTIDQLAPNSNLYRWFLYVLIHSNNRVIIMGRSASDSLTSLFLERSQYMKKASEIDLVVPISWTCFIKSFGRMDGTTTEHVLITVVPSSIEELYKLRRYLVADANLMDAYYKNGSYGNETEVNTEEYDTETAPEIQVNDETEAHCSYKNLKSENKVNLSIPVMIFDSTESMADAEEFINDSHINEQQSIFYDYRFEKSLSNSLNARFQFQDKDGLPGVDKQRESNVLSQKNSNKLLAEHCSNISNIYHYCYIFIIHECLQAATPVDYAVIQSAIDELCADTYAEIDITTFMRCMSSRFKSCNRDIIPRGDEELLLRKNYKISPTENQDLRDYIISSCWNIDNDAIQSKKFAINTCFTEIVSENFILVPNSTNLFYHKDSLEEVCTIFCNFLFRSIFF